MEQRENVFVTERSADGNYKKPAQQWSCSVRKRLSRTRSIVRFAMRVPSYSAAKRDDEYNVKTSKRRWPRIMSELREL